MQSLDYPETKYLDLAEGALGRVPAAFRELFPGKTALPVADLNTWNAAGRDLYGALREAGVPTHKPFVFLESPRETDAAVREVLAAMDAADAEPDATGGVIPLAIGSGTINDLCKRAAFLRDRAYFCFATAASVDGFVSFGAPITDDGGFKITRPCPAPRGIAAEPAILERAPKALTSSGYGDLFGKYTAGADWVLASLVTDDNPVHPQAWALVHDRLHARTVHPKELSDGETAPLTDLFEGLVSSGFAMQVSRSSRPASGTEHHYAHAWEMAHLKGPDGKEPSHGHKVALGSICALLAYIKLFEKPFARDDIPAALAAYPDWSAREAFVRSLFPAGPLCEAVLAECQAKQLEPDALRARLERVADTWDTIRNRVDEQLMYLPRMKAMLDCAGCPTTPAQLGLTPERAAATTFAAQMIRRRYTVLDLAYETGRLPEVAAAVAEGLAVLQGARAPEA